MAPTTFQRNALLYVATHPGAIRPVLVNWLSTSTGSFQRSANLMIGYGWITQELVGGTPAFTITAAGRAVVGLAPIGKPAAAARIAPLYSYRASFFASTSYWKRQLPADRPVFQHPTIPEANSANWISSLCLQMGYDPQTPKTSPLPGLVPGRVNGMSFLGREDMPLYIVPDDQPYREFPCIGPAPLAQYTHTARLDQRITNLGGLPVPYEATVQDTGDHYMHVYQPSRDLFVSLYSCAARDPATATLSTQGAPTSGELTLRILYGDNYRTPVWYTTAPIPFDATATQLQLAVVASKNATGAILGYPTAANCITSGGPLPAPITMLFSVATPLQTVKVEVLTSTLDRGGMVVNTHPSGPIDRCRAGGILQPVSQAAGTYKNRVDPVTGLYLEDYRWGGAATSIEFMAGYPEAEEVRRAQAAGTGLDHAVVLNIAHCQRTPVPFVWPATRADGDRFLTPGYICEGSRVALPADVDLSYCERNAPEWVWMLKTLRDYGAIIPDKTGVGCGLRFRRASWDDTPGYNPWREILPKYQTLGSAAGNEYMRYVPWHQAQIVDPEFSR